MGQGSAVPVKPVTTVDRTASTPLTRAGMATTTRAPPLTSIPQTNIIETRETTETSGTLGITIDHVTGRGDRLIPPVLPVEPAESVACP